MFLNPFSSFVVGWERDYFDFPHSAHYWCWNWICAGFAFSLVSCRLVDQTNRSLFLSKWMSENGDRRHVCSIYRLVRTSFVWHRSSSSSRSLWRRACWREKMSSLGFCTTDRRKSSFRWIMFVVVRSPFTSAANRAPEREWGRKDFLLMWFRRRRLAGERDDDLL